MDMNLYPQRSVLHSIFLGNLGIWIELSLFDKNGFTRPYAHSGSHPDIHGGIPGYNRINLRTDFDSSQHVSFFNSGTPFEKRVDSTNASPGYLIHVAGDRVTTKRSFYERNRAFVCYKVRAVFIKRQNSSQGTPVHGCHVVIFVNSRMMSYIFNVSA